MEMISYRFTCPKCGNDTMHVAVSKGRLLYECMSCNYGHIEPYVWQPVAPSSEMLCGHSIEGEWYRPVGDCDEPAVFVRKAAGHVIEQRCARHAGEADQ
jgi:ribosomal protein L37E